MADDEKRAGSAQGVLEASPRGVDLVVAGLIAFGVYHLALGLFMVVAPGSFFTEIGPFGAQNDHYIRDTATFNFAFGVGLLAAVRRPSWRVPVLAVVLIQFVLHAVNHLVDIGEAEPESVGVVDFVALLVGAALLAGLLVAARREAAAGAPGRLMTGGRPPSR